MMVYNTDTIQPFNEDWRDYAETNEPEFYERLGECRNKAIDVVLMANIMHRYNPHKSPLQCFEHAVEWVCDWNGQLAVYDKISANMDWYLKRVH